MDGVPDEKVMRLRYTGTCRICEVDLPKRVEAVYEWSTTTVRCVANTVQKLIRGMRTQILSSGLLRSSLSPEQLGLPPRREFERRKARREKRIRANPKLGGLIRAVADDPQSTTAWDVGALGEEKLGQGLDRRASDTVRLLHDRSACRARICASRSGTPASRALVMAAVRSGCGLMCRGMLATVAIRATIR